MQSAIMTEPDLIVSFVSGGEHRDWRGPFPPGS